jgi:hypothetical protein
MEAIREQSKNPLVVGIVAFVVGLIIGLVVLGWWLWPVQWTDAAPADLRPEFQEIYLRMAIDQYTLRPDTAVAQQHIAEIGADAPQILAEIAADPQNQNPDSIQTFIMLSGEAVAIPPTGEVTQPPDVTPEVTPGLTPAVTPPAEGAAGTTSTARKLLPWFCLITLVLALGLVALFLLRNRSLNVKWPSVRKEPAPQAAYPEYPVTSEETPLAQFMTTYQTGNDLYDDSFSIDSQAGEFLGECGVGISDTIGVGDPKKVTAFEVWLFDKNDIQTVTKVLMSRHAFNDESIRQRLAAKGEPVPADPGHEMVLETATLRLTARVVDMSYGMGALPAESYFDRMTLELVAWSKV